MVRVCIFCECWTVIKQTCVHAVFVNEAVWGGRGSLQGAASVPKRQTKEDVDDTQTAAFPALEHFVSDPVY